MLKVDLSGKRYGRLLVVKKLGKDRGKYWYECVCDCSAVVRANHGALQSSNTKSCGCLGNDNRAALLEKRTTHGHSVGGKRSKEHLTWHNIKQRCTNPNNQNYKYYGGRGITVCDRWIHNFEKFFQDMGPAKPGESIERIDVNGNYEPSNCKWLPLSEQYINKRFKMVAEFKGKMMKSREIGDLIGVPRQTINYWIRKGTASERLGKYQ